MSRRVAVVDANVLYSIELTDLLLSLAVHRLVRLHWSPTILDEVRRNLALRVDLAPDAVDYRIERMNLALPAALDDAPEPLIASMPIAEHDRHVLALAVHVDADSVVTFNLRDFPSEQCEPYGVEAVDPDAFTAAIVDTDAAAVKLVLAEIAGRRRRPAMAVDDLLDRLAATLPSFVERVRPLPQ